MRYIVKQRTGGGWQVLDQKTNMLLGPFSERRIAEDRAEKLNREHERTKGKP
jgi:hypothetical protein